MWFEFRRCESQQAAVLIKQRKNLILKNFIHASSPPLCKQFNRANNVSKNYRNEKGFAGYVIVVMTSGIKKRLDIIWNCKKCVHISSALSISCMYTTQLVVPLSSKLHGSFNWGVSRILSHKLHRSFYLLKIISWQDILLPCPQGIVCNKSLQITIPGNSVIQSPSSTWNRISSSLSSS